MPAIKIPSVCMPRVFIRFDEDYINRVFCDLFGGAISQPDRASCIDRIDMIQREDKRTGELFHVVFIHFVEEGVISSPEAVAFVEKITANEEVKIEYSHPWFWKVRKNNATKHTRRGPRILSEKDTAEIRAAQKALPAKAPLYTAEDHNRASAEDKPVTT